MGIQENKNPQISKRTPLFRCLGKMNQGDMGVSLNGGTPKSSILIGISIIFTIHFGGFPPMFGNIHMVFLQQLWLFCMLIPVSFRVCDVKRPRRSTKTPLQGRSDQGGYPFHSNSTRKT